GPMHEATRDALRGRADVSADDIDDIVALAAELQEADLPRGATLEEVQAVAEELDIAPEYVERAVRELSSRREREADAQRVEALRAAERWRVLRIAAASAAVALG